MLNSSIANKRPSIVWLTKQEINDKIDANLMHCKFINLLDIQYSNMKSNINVKYNGELIDELTDFTANGSFKSLSQNVNYIDEAGIPFIRIKNMSEAGLVWEDLKYIDLPTYEYLKKSKLEGDELLFSKTGANLGLAMVFPNNLGRTSLADNIFKVIYKKEFDVHYIASFFNCVYGKLWIERFSQGSAQPTIIKESFRQIKIPIPSPEIQKYIGDKVRKAEELREEAKRLKKEAEEIIAIEFKFSELENTLNENNTKLEWLDQSLLGSRCDSQFYINKTSMINKKIKKLGLELQKISDIAKVGKGFSYVSNYGITEIPYVRISDLNELEIDFDNVVCTDIQTYNLKKASKLEKYDLILAITGATIGKISIFINEEIDKATLSADTAYIRFNDISDASYVLLYLRSDIGSLGIQQGITGATNKHLAVDHIMNICIPKVSKDIKEKILFNVTEAVKSIYYSKQLIQEAKKDVEDLIEGNFDMSKLNKS